jgi:hypothetical protein
MISQAYAHKVETTLHDFAEHLDSLDKGMNALAAANEGLCASLNSQAPVDGDNIASLFDIVLADMKQHTDAMQDIIIHLKPAASVGTG